jgi:hypothetical protein
MRQYICVLLFALVPILTFAQGENDNWYFGDSASVNFASPTPSILTGSNMFALEACGTVSDTSGNLMFYTNGQYIWNRQHQVMQNGSIIGGSYSSQQLAIVKHPQNPNQYFVFNTGDNGYSTADAYYYTISYSIVDMSLGPLGTNGQPLGAVVPGFKSIPVLDNLGGKFLSEAITVVPSNVTGAYWLLIPNGTKLYSYAINGLGFVNGNPVISDLNLPFTLGHLSYYGIRASAKLNNGSFSNYLCISVWAQSTLNKVYSFDNVSGQITNDYTMEISSMRAYLPEFNKDASVLFLGYKKIFAIDMLTSSTSTVNFMEIYNGSLSIPTQEDGIAIQRNRYDEIYLSKAGRSYLGKIINPDVYGSGMSVDMNFVNLGSKIAYYGLPQLIHTGAEPEPQCPSDLLLTLPETHNLHTYQVSNTITTKERYTVFPKQDITMKAGKNITMLPNTYIMYGARLLATIAACEPSEEYLIEKKGREKVALYLDLDKDLASADAVTVYPNPVSTVAIIDTKKERLVYWELYDILGKLVLKGNDSKINAAVLAKHTYLLKIGTGNGAVAYKKLIIQ